jgi:DNA polymerase V
MYFRDPIYFYNAVVFAGFPSPSEDLFISQVSLQDHLIKNSYSTICIKVSGDSMIDIGIFSGDILIVDRSLKPKNNQVILCVLDGKFLVKKLSKIKDSITLISENKNYPPITIKEYNDFNIFGVVIASIKKFL